MTEITSDNNSIHISTTIGSGGSHRFADLSTALVRFCIQDGDEASQEISERLSTIQNFVNNAKAAITEGNNADVTQQLDSITNEVMNTVIALQFFDRISQRMDHAVQAIEAIGDAASEKSKTLDQRFTMDDERILYDALQEGCTVDQALERASQKLDATIESQGSDIELF